MNDDLSLFDLEDLRQYIPPGWLDGTEGNAVWIAAYRILWPLEAKLKESPKLFDLGDVRGIALLGTIRYPLPGHAKVELRSEEEWEYSWPAPEAAATATECHLLLITPYVLGRESGHAVLARQRVGFAVGLLTAYNGRNIAYERLFEVALNSSGFDVHLEQSHNPLPSLRPSMDDDRVRLLEETHQALTQTDTEARNASVLAVRWFEAGLRGFGVDAFLSCWIALEALALAN